MIARRGLLMGAAAAFAAGPACLARASEPFAQWLAGLRAEALAAGIRPVTLDAALRNVGPIDEVVRLDRRQPEGRMSFREYRERVISKARVAQGRRLLARHRPLLDGIEARYGVPARFLVALWGIESSYGNHTGGFPVVGALATLAWDGRRADFFRRELLNALEILDSGEVTADVMQGSWAGAMGQPQFMPSTYLAHAVDHDRDGRRDIWSSHPDIFASMANYLAAAGWDREYMWGREVRVPDGSLADLAGLEVRRALGSWSDLGIRRIDGGRLPAAPIEASLLVTDGGKGPSYLVYDNFRVLMVWNRSTYFALSVSILADLLRTR